MNAPIHCDKPLIQKILTATKLFTHLFKVARLIGHSKQTAAYLTNRAVKNLTQIDLLASLDYPHLKAANHPLFYCHPTHLEPN